MKRFLSKAFSLAEILMVLAIFGALSVIVLATVNPGSRLAVGRNAVRLNDVTAIQAATERFASNVGLWPAGLTTEYKPACKEGVTSSVCLAAGLVDLSGLSINHKYLTAIPSDPSNVSTVSSGYEIARTAGGYVLVRAPLAELNIVISTSNGGLCEPQCTGKVCGSDGCGGSCGTCSAGLFCSGSGTCTSTPVCLYEGDATFCSRFNKNCQFSGLDNCGSSRTVLCGFCTMPDICGGSGVAGVCGCTAETNTAFCTRLNKNCSFTGLDNCSVSRTVNCGTCASPQTCGGSGISGVCGCTSETNTAFCTRLGKNCGSVTNTDNCGVSRTVNCGTCTSPDTCGAITANVCGCASETNTAFCTRLGKNCSFTGLDNCSVFRTVNCGTCTSPQTCGGSGISGVCGCTSETNAAFCTRLGKNCGSVTSNDNCGISRTVNCGTCTSPQTCGGSGTANVCGCTSETNTAFCTRLGKNCGSVTNTDNCGVSRTVNCGTCTSPQTCGGSGISGVCGCTSETDTAFCSRLGKNCGSVSSNDNCGISRTVNCGTCSSPDTCGAITANVCGCASETNTAFCTRLGKNCGSVTDNDDCGISRTVNCGTCTSPDTCGAITANVCGCLPNCSGKSCGSDGCGGSCGTCPGGLACDGSGNCKPSTQECTTNMAYGTTCGGGILICKTGNGNCSANLVVAPAGCVYGSCSGSDWVKYSWESPNDNVSETGYYTASNMVGYRNLNGNATPTADNYNPSSKYKAAKVCADLSAGGFTDWYLPSREELCVIRLSSSYCNSGSSCFYASRSSTQNCLNGSTPTNPFVSDIVSNYYWSSTQNNATNAYNQDMSGGSQAGYNKVGNYYIRCVRRF